jgi:prepilin peptidase CpaA
MSGHIITSLFLLAPITILITYYDVRYRRIPNLFVLATLINGFFVNTWLNGADGFWLSLKGGAIAFGLMLILHVFSAMGAGDVKLFGAIGAVIGASLVLKTFLIVVLTGGVLALILSAQAGRLRETMNRVMLIFINLLSGWQPPRFPTPADQKHTIPYGVAITCGTIISLAFFRHQ